MAAKSDRQGLLPAPAPVPLSRLLPLDVLVELRDQAAQRVAALSAPAQPTTRAATTPPALEQPPALPASTRAPMLVGY